MGTTKRATARVVPILGAVLVVIGAIWIFQGIGVLPGSFMTGQIEWAVYGALTSAAGLALLRLRRA